MAYSEDVGKKQKSIFESNHFSVVKSHKAPGIKDFDIIKPISRGAFGQVYLSKKKCSDKLYALKVMKKSDVLTKNMMEQVIAERDAFAVSSKCPFVVQLFYSFQSDEKIYLVMEYMIGGDLKSLLHNLGYFDEHMSRVYIAEVALALEYLHGHSIYHRDIKPDNMLMSDKGHIKLTDFGLSCLTSARKPNYSDLINTPRILLKDENNTRSSKIFWRTPGQLQSLTSKFTFSIPRKKTRNLRVPEQSQTSIGIASFKTSCNFQFSPPSTFANVPLSMSVLSTPRCCRNSSTPNVTGNTGLTSDVTSLSLEVTQRKRNYIKINDDNEKENIPDRKKLRVYSQSMPNEVSYEVEPSRKDVNFKQNTVKFNDQVKHCGTYEIHCYDQSIVMSSLTDNIADTSNEHVHHDNSGNENISGVTALTETSHMSISSTSELGMISPYNTHGDIRNSTAGQNSLKFTPSPSQCVVYENHSKYSPSLTPNDIYSKGRTNSEMIVTPVQMLQFFDGSSPTGDKNTCFVTPPDEGRVEHTPEGHDFDDMKPNAVTPKRTPFRTPKSCVRGKATPAEKKILGTPDYLAPEILCGKEYGAPVDWWALGVCFYEFLTGIPPFNDDTPELVFEHILDRDLLWPEGEECLSENAVDAIEALLTADPDLRPNAEQIKNMACFNELNWGNLLNEKASFVPQPDDLYDTTYFSARNNANHLQMSIFKP